MEKVYKIKVLEKIDEGYNRVTLIFNVPEGFQWEPGAHISLALEGYDKDGTVNRDLVRKFSINSLPEDGRISVTTRTDSSDSLYKKIIAEMPVGTQCYIIESGCRLPIRREDRTIVFMSMGVGLATIRPILNAVKKDHHGIKSVINVMVNKTDDLLYKSEIYDGSYSELENIYCANRNEFKDTLMDICKKTDDKIFYVVGSKPYVRSTVQLLKSQGVLKKDIMLDKKPGKLDLIYDDCQ